uniref:NB-ARC domain-containing protein n=1 Tax=Chenopodium quinoa TaxID=63459 RepID=A0A803MLP8_CHEQI
MSLRKRRPETCSYVYAIGGLGKTALAQLVYNDERVRKAFKSRLWTCVADQDHKQLDIEGILGKILVSATGLKNEGSTPESVRNQLRELLASNKYLLVLDDVWTEHCDQ